MSKGRIPRGRLPWHRGDEVPQFIGDTRDGYPKPDGKYTFDKLSSVYITGNATRDDAPNHIRLHKQRAAGDRRELGVDVPGRGLRDPRGRAGDAAPWT